PARLHVGAWQIDASPKAENEQDDPDVRPPAPDQLDYVLLRLDRDVGRESRTGPGNPARGWIVVPAVEPPAVPGEFLAIPYFPLATRPIQRAVGPQAILGFNPSRPRLRYTVEADPGASGAPCFDHAWNLVAVHQLARWGIGSQGYRQGIPIAAIRGRLR